MTCRLPALVQVLGNVELGYAALRHIGATHVHMGPAMLDIEAFAIGVENQILLVLSGGALGRTCAALVSVKPSRRLPRVVNHRREATKLAARRVENRG